MLGSSRFRATADDKPSQRLQPQQLEWERIMAAIIFITIIIMIIACCMLWLLQTGEIEFSRFKGQGAATMWSRPPLTAVSRVDSNLKPTELKTHGRIGTQGLEYRVKSC